MHISRCNAKLCACDSQRRRVCMPTRSPDSRSQFSSAAQHLATEHTAQPSVQQQYRPPLPSTCLQAKDAQCVHHIVALLPHIVDALNNTLQRGGYPRQMVLWAVDAKQLSKANEAAVRI